MIDNLPKPILSQHFQSRQPSAIRLAQIEFAKRTDGVKAINVAIGNVTLPLHPRLMARLKSISIASSPFQNGVVKYTPSVGTAEANQAFLHILRSSGFKIDGLYSQITDGGSAAMELVILGVCGQPGTADKPLLLIDAAYTNYTALAKRVGRNTVSISRILQDDGTFTLPNINEIEQQIIKFQPGAIVVIPYDNPTGQFFDHQTLVELARLCVKHNLWLISDEAYRELFYVAGKTSSVWGLTEQEVPGIYGRRISIESASKIWNGCGLRIGALITDNQNFHEKAVAEYTANLCASALGQYIFAGLNEESPAQLNQWYEQQRNYYRRLMTTTAAELKRLIPGLIVSAPQAAIYSVIDVRNLDPKFDAKEFVLYCAREGHVDGWTLLVAPMNGFYSVSDGCSNPGQTQLRLAYVETPERMEKVPELLAALLHNYLLKKGKCF